MTRTRTTSSGSEKGKKDTVKKAAATATTGRTRSGSGASTGSGADSGRKKGASAFQMYLRENREKVEAEHPSMTYKQVQKHCGDAWKEMNDDEKVKYRKMAEAHAPKEEQVGK